jgi:hypothetical protein
VSFTPLERAVLDAICEADAADREALQAQFATATLRSRGNTGGGFFTHFDVDRSTSPVGGARLRDGPVARIDGLQGWMGFILWLNEGFADCLEGYSYEGSTAAVDLEAARFDLLRTVADALTMTATGKISKKDLRAHFAEYKLPE